jgi:hypothetical protein
MARSPSNDGNGRSIVILDPDDGSPLIVIVPHPAETSDKPAPGEDIAPPEDKK